MSLTLNKKLSAVTAEQLEKDLIANLSGVKNFIVDMSKLSYVSSAGLRVFIEGSEVYESERRKHDTEECCA